MFNVGRRLNLTELSSYDVLPDEILKNVKVIKMPRISKTFTGITLGKYIFLSKKLEYDGKSLLIAHELVHVRQWHELGVIGFLWKYLSEFFKGLVKEKNWMKAYNKISLEQEAQLIANLWQERKR